MFIRLVVGTGQAVQAQASPGGRLGVLIRGQLLGWAHTPCCRLSVLGAATRLVAVPFHLSCFPAASPTLNIHIQAPPRSNRNHHDCTDTHTKLTERLLLFETPDTLTRDSGTLFRRAKPKSAPALAWPPGARIVGHL